MTRFFPVLLAALLAVAASAQSPSAYPNPLGSGPLTIQNAPDDADFELYDVLGRRLAARSSHAAGVYLWRLRLADGSHTDAQAFTKLTSGPVEVRLVQETAPGPARLGPLAETAVMGREDCRVVAPVFGGFQFEPLRGSNLEIEQTATVISTGTFASSLTCLGGVDGVGMHFPVGDSPWHNEDGELFLAELVGALNDPGSTPAQATISVKAVPGGFGDVRMLLDKSSPKLVEILNVAPDGTETVVASTVIPADTPETRRLARVGAAGGATGIEVAAMTMSHIRPTDTAPLDSVASIRLDFRPTGAGWIIIQSAAGPVQGNAIVVTTPLDGWIIIESAKLQTTAPGYEVDDIGFSTSDPEGVAEVATAIPAWLRTADPNNQVWKSPAGLEVRCARGASCGTFGVRATSSLGNFENQGFTAGLQPLPPASRFAIGGLQTWPGRGLLFGTSSRFETTADYAVAPPSGPPVEGVARVTLQTLGSVSLIVQVDDLGETQTVSGGEVRYIREGIVRRQFPLTDGAPVDLGLRVELSDAETSWVTIGGQTTLLLRYTDIFRPNSEVEVRLALGPPGPASYQKIEWTYGVPWSFGFSSTGSACPVCVQ